MPSTEESIRSYFYSYRNLLSRNPSKVLLDKYANRKICRQFAARLHGFTHLTFDDTREICLRAGVLTPVLQQALEAVVEKCTTRRSTGCPLLSQKVSFRLLLVPFNNHVQVDFSFISELENLPILHMVDLSSAFSVTVMLETRELGEVNIASGITRSNFMVPRSHCQGTQKSTKKSLRTFLLLTPSRLSQARLIDTIRWGFLSQKLPLLGIYRRGFSTMPSTLRLLTALRSSSRRFCPRLPF